MAESAEQALRAVATYVRTHSDVFVVAGPKRLSREETTDRQSLIEQVANRLDELANTSIRLQVSYRQFETLLVDLRQLGSALPSELVSNVARALHAQAT
jgi:RNase H-fold protein (predicted Holliday junction resolvase)